MDLAILSALQRELLSRGSLDAHQGHVWQRLCAQNTWSSSAIEGVPLTHEEVDSIIVSGTSVGDRPVRDVLVVIQHGAAFMGLLKRLRDPITVDTARELHDDVFRGVLPGHGEWRRVALHIAGSGFHTPAPGAVGEEMSRWEEVYRDRCKRNGPVMELAAWMHHGFEAIHPFDGGNGRVGRLLMNLHLLKHGWPPVSFLPGERIEYFDALEKGNGGDLAVLEELLRVAVARSILELLDLLGKGEDGLRPLEELVTRGPGFVAFMVHKADERELPALRRGNTWYSSRRALGLFNGEDGEG